MATDVKIEHRLNGLYVDGAKLKDETFDNLGIPMVGQAMTMEAYAQKEYAHVKSLEGTRFKAQLQEAGKVYGEQLHEIQGDGNCLTTAFATSLLYILNGNLVLISKLDEILVGLDAHKDIHFVLQALKQLKVKNDSELEKILSNNEVMLAFSSVIRQMARQRLPEVDNLFFSEDVIDVMVPPKDGEEIEIACIGGLCQLLSLRADVIVLDKNNDAFTLHQYPNETGKPDLVILRKAAHFLSIIPKSKKSVEEKTDELAKDRIKPPVETPPIDKPVTQELFNRRWLFALLALAVLGALYYFFNSRSN